MFHFYKRKCFKDKNFHLLRLTVSWGNFPSWTGFKVFNSKNLQKVSFETGTGKGGHLIIRLVLYWGYGSIAGSAFEICCSGLLDIIGC